MLMEKTLLAVALFLLGLVLGSFVNAAVWRIKNKKRPRYGGVPNALTVTIFLPGMIWCQCSAG